MYGWDNKIQLGKSSCRDWPTLDWPTQHIPRWCHVVAEKGCGQTELHFAWKTAPLIQFSVQWGLAPWGAKAKQCSPVWRSTSTFFVCVIRQGACWPVTCMWVHIPGGLLYNLNAVFLLFTSRLNSYCWENFPELYNPICGCTNHSAVFWCPRNFKHINLFFQLDFPNHTITSCCCLLL